MNLPDIPQIAAVALFYSGEFREMEVFSDYIRAQSWAAGYERGASDAREDDARAYVWPTDRREAEYASHEIDAADAEYWRLCAAVAPRGEHE